MQNEAREKKIVAEFLANLFKSALKAVCTHMKDQCASGNTVDGLVKQSCRERRGRL